MLGRDTISLRSSSNMARTPVLCAGNAGSIPADQSAVRCVLIGWNVLEQRTVRDARCAKELKVWKGLG